MTIAFYILAAIAVLGAVMAITLRNVVHAVFSVLLFFSALAGLFMLLLAEFIAAVQVLVYIGSVGILMLFAIMLTTKVTGDPTRNLLSRGWGWGSLLAGALLLAFLVPLITQSPIRKRISASQFQSICKTARPDFNGSLLCIGGGDRPVAHRRTDCRRSGCQQRI